MVIIIDNVDLKKQNLVYLNEMYQIVNNQTVKFYFYKLYYKDQSIHSNYLPENEEKMLSAGFVLDKNGNLILETF